MKVKPRKNISTQIFFVCIVFSLRASEVIAQIIPFNSGDYTVPLNQAGTISFNTDSTGNAGTLTIPASATLSQYGSSAPYRLYSGGSVAAINNAGTLSATTAPGMLLQGSVGSIVNSGTISSTVWYGIENSGSIGSITNTGAGHISHGIAVNYDISNTGSIGALSNAQSGLTYSGNLPSNYKVIIYSLSNYGQTAFSNVSPSSALDGKMNFGIGAGSRILISNSTYASVISGVGAANLGGTSGSLGGGIASVNWSLVANGVNNWDLNVSTAQRVSNPSVPSSAAATSQIAAVTASYNSAMSGGLNPTLSNGSLLTSAVQGLTSSQVNQFINVHAEGYSSNMTIGLEQMAHITNTVMDRIHAPMSSSPSTKVYQDDEGRYIWADAAAVKGTVNNYNNLAGFGYNLYDLILGGDIKRSKDGGYGIFAGTGTTSMTESQQVTQNFNTTNFYAGLYGALNFSEQVKLSGALGYMYGNTNANRNTPSVGLFTGGNATSSYKSNGVYGAAKLAKAYQFSDITVSPFVGASYSQLWMGGASEQGGNDFNFAINSAAAYTAVTFAGADFVYPFLRGTNNPLSLIGFYKVGYDWYANSNGAHSITAVSPTYGSFTQVGANMGPVSNMFGLGIQGGITKDVSARIGVVASVNSYGQEYGGGAELRFKF